MTSSTTKPAPHPFGACRDQLKDLCSYCKAARTNPPDCICEHVHASVSWCKSKEVSRGAVPENERLYPASTPSLVETPRPAHFHKHPDDTYSACDCAEAAVDPPSLVSPSQQEPDILEKQSYCDVCRERGITQPVYDGQYSIVCHKHEDDPKNPIAASAAVSPTLSEQSPFSEDWPVSIWKQDGNDLDRWPMFQVRLLDDENLVLKEIRGDRQKAEQFAKNINKRLAEAYSLATRQETK